MHLSAKPPQRQDLPPRKWPQGGSKTTTSIGRRRKRGNAFNRPILIPRVACMVYLFAAHPRTHARSRGAPQTRRPARVAASIWQGNESHRLVTPPFPGAHGGVEIPVPIPNTEVKGPIGESTAGVARGRVARRRVSLRGRVRPHVGPGPLLFLRCLLP